MPISTFYSMDFTRFKELRWRVLLGIVNAGLAFSVILLPYIYVGPPANQDFYIYNLPGDWLHVGVFIFSAILALVAIISFSYDFVLPILGGIAAAIDLTFAVGVVILGYNPTWSLNSVVPRVGGIISIGVMILMLIQGYIWLQLRSEDVRGEKPALQESNASTLEKSP